MIVWASSGPFFKFNDTWQLVINTGTTIVTFLMVFLIQHTQNADTAAIHIKLDELIRVTSNANNELLNLEEMDQERLEEIRLRYEQLAKTAEHLKAKKDLCMPCSRRHSRVAGLHSSAHQTNERAPSFSGSTHHHPENHHGDQNG